MKKTNKKPEDLREQWKSLAEDEIIQLNEDIDTLELPEDTVLEIEKYINRYKDRLNDAIDNFEVTTKIALQNDEILENILDEVKYDGLRKSVENSMIDMLEMEGHYIIKAPSLSEQIKVEAFLNEMKVNPYQLALVS
jgi:hypothetical protein